MSWTIEISRKAAKQLEDLSEEVQLVTQVLIQDLSDKGPNPGPGWKNYGKLKGTKKGVDLRHCHLMKGKPTYVACWEVTDKKMKLMEVYYVGTHEKAPY